MVQRTAVAAVKPALRRFAERLCEQIGAERVLLFGSHARGTAARDSDYDFIVVADHYRSIRPLDREHGLHDLFYEVVGVAPLDFICLTPEEFEKARRSITLVAAVLPESIDLLASEVAAT
jgi:predicted nucleotidyltransferase